MEKKNLRQSRSRHAGRIEHGWRERRPAQTHLSKKAEQYGKEETMQEYIGKVCMDYTWYPGEDLYSDGEIEDRLLEIAENYREEELNQVIDREKDWAVLYHMSHIRQNIINWMPMKKTDKVLEIGAGCGAITGALAKKAGSVTCVDLSKKRSLVNANRHKDLDNIRIIVGNFQDIEPNLSEQYDYITLIGVFEYAKGYIGTNAPYTEFLRQVMRHLKPGGKLVIAIENRLGLKYWAGCREDHTGKLFEGLENYPNPETGVRTFSKPELEALFDQVGLKKRQFYYPYPDYKLPMTVYSDEYLPKKGELNSNIWNFDRERMVLFDETKVYDSLLESEVFPLFSNSYLVVLEKEGGWQRQAERVLYSKFSNERRRTFAIRTDIVKTADGKISVHKTADAAQGTDFIEKLKEHAQSLKGLFSNTGILVNELQTSKTGEAVFTYIEEAVTLEQQLYKLWNDEKKETAVEQMNHYLKEICELATVPFEKTEAFTEMFGDVDVPEDAMSMPVTDLDLVTENILLCGEQRHLIDFEWTFDFPIPVEFVCYRIWHYFIQRNIIKQPDKIIMLLEDLGFDMAAQRRYERMEKAFQQYVTGSHVPIREMYRFITPGCVSLEKSENGGSEQCAGYYGSTLFYSETAQFIQENSIVSSMQVKEDGSFIVTFSLDGLEVPKYLRWDPLEGKVCSIVMESISAEKPLAVIAVNGQKENGRDMFFTTDPIYKIEGDFSGIHTIVIRGSIRIFSTAEALEKLSKRSERMEEYRTRMEKAEALLSGIYETKGFRVLEKARRTRNNLENQIKLFHSKKEKGHSQKQEEYQLWAAEHRANEKMLEQQRQYRPFYEPKISILVPVYCTPIRYLTEMIESVRSQSYCNWELCIADASMNDDLTNCLTDYANKDARIRFVSLKENGGIAENTNAAAELATGAFIGLLDHDDLLAPEALYEVTMALQDQITDVVYTDEDKISMNSDRYFDPNLKPDFSPDLLRSHNYITHFFVVKKELFDRVGRFRRVFDGAQDYDLILRCTELAENIRHIPKILYHWRMHADSTAENPESKLYAYEAGKHAIEEHLERCGRKGTVEIMPLWGMNRVRYETPGDPLVSVVIPNMDHIEDLDRCVRSILEKNTYPNVEILIIENNSRKKDTFLYYKKLREEFPQIRVLRWEKEFNYSAINNYGVKKANGDYILLLNNDTELIEPDSIREMVGLCMQRETGCVGAKLLFADDTVQHAGIVLGFGGFAGHVFSRIGRDALGYMMRARIIGNFSAVTAACLMVRREVYEQVGGLDESFAVALNDVDFCLRVRKAGYLNVLQPFSLWYHYESKSRGYEDTPEKAKRFEKEVARFRERWGETIDAGDPYYNPNFSVQKEPFMLR